MNPVTTFFALASLIVSLGCGGGSPPADDFVGTWNAESCVYTNASDTSQSADLVVLGGSYEMTLNADGSYEVVATLPGESGFTTSGTWEASIDLFTLNYAVPFTGSAQFEFNLSNDTLTLTGADSSYDFDDDGTPDDAKLDMVLIRAD